MRVSPAAAAAVALAAALSPSSGFAPRAAAAGRGRTADDDRPRHLPVLRAAPDAPPEEAAAPSQKKRRLGLVTFDLDDTLYPIAPVLDEANAAFSAAMANFGYVGIGPDDIVETGKAIRASTSGDAPGDDPLRPATVNHKEIRTAAIRKEMEGFILRTKLEQTAEDWATEVESLTSPVRKSAEKWARTTVHSSVVQAVYNAWEMERHHAAERHLFPDAIDAIKRVREDHPDVVVGAVTNGSSNPMLMVFSLMPLFDFSVSWEDDLGSSAGSAGRFRELGDVDRSDGLSWIYRLAVDKGREMSDLAGEIQKGGSGGGNGDGDEDFEWAWVHVGDDLAYDVGGSATTGARTVHVDLAPEYGQTARLRREGRRPAWTTETEEELEKHRAMSINALDKVDATITHLGQLPEAINELMKGGGEEEEAGGE